MNGITVRARCTRTLRLLTVLSAALLLSAACDDPPNEASAPVIPTRALPEGLEVVYGTVNKANPFEGVGLRHNDLVHAVLTSTEPWDTLSIPTMLSHIQKSIPAWGEEALQVPPERGIAHVKTAFAMKIDTTARRRLAEFDMPGYTARETGYLRQLGTLLCEARTFAALEGGLLDLERRILAETWSADGVSESAARIAISVAKHSCAYWKQVFCIASDIDPTTLTMNAAARRNALQKPAELLIHLVTKTELILAADVMAATSAGEAAAPLGPLHQLEAAIISGGAVSIVVTVLVYFDEIVKFLRSLCPWHSAQ
jgi:hypothetical protein